MYTIFDMAEPYATIFSGDPVNNDLTLAGELQMSTSLLLRQYHAHPSVPSGKQTLSPIEIACLLSSFDVSFMEFAPDCSRDFLQAHHHLLATGSGARRVHGKGGFGGFPPLPGR